MQLDGSKEIWVTCPQCAQHFNVSNLFCAPKFDKVQLHCPGCGTDFAKEQSPKSW